MKETFSPAGLASRFINSTGRHIFLTGKAGTGKTTFLRDIVQYTHKKVIVAAPTGIAAINAGGVTLHSLFQLPFGAFLPTEERLSNIHITTQVNTPKTMLGKLKMHATRRKLIREMELLIIDEVSMLRADLLDAIDTVLRHIHRKRHIPFGGIQILFIGDLYQLPPVVKQDEWDLLQRYYEGIYFFNAMALKSSPPLCIELETIYRQTDPRFIALLNNLRDNRPSHEDIDLLNEHVKPGFSPGRDAGYIFLTTHNHKADTINSKALQQLKKPPYTFDAIVADDFPEHLYPMEYSLLLKEGAQVMFIKNDYSGERRYFNGKIGLVDEISEEGITVSFSDGSPPAEVERYIWENKKYSLNNTTGDIEERVAGTFTQFPLKLAWSVTVHKSQGLTFERAVIDVSGAFAPGQIYVALSRLTGLGGLVLSASLPQHTPGPDYRLQRYFSQQPHGSSLSQDLEEDTMQYLSEQLGRTFDFGPLSEEIGWHLESYNKEENRSAKQRHHDWAKGLRTDFVSVKQVADRFSGELKRIMDARPERSNDADYEASMRAFMVHIGKRLSAASDYFSPLLKELSFKIFAHIDVVAETSGTKTYVRELRELEQAVFNRLQLMQKAELLIKVIVDGREPTRDNMRDDSLTREREIMAGKHGNTSGKKGKKGKKGGGRRKKDLGEDLAQNLNALKEPGESAKAAKQSSHEITLTLFNEGLDTEAIATIRSLSPVTIENHLARCIGEGLLEATRLIDIEKLTQIKAAALAVDSSKLADIMAVLGDEFTYADIKYALGSRTVE